MKKIITDLKQFILMHSVLHWLTVIVFCSITVYLNFSNSLEKSFRYYDPLYEYLAFFAMYFIHFSFGYFCYSLFKKDFKIWTQAGFILLLVLACLIFAYRACSQWHFEWISELSGPQSSDKNNRVYGDIFRLLYLIIPVTLIWFLIDRDQNPYGFSVEHHKWKIYTMLLLCMIPLIVGASFLSDFLSYYPRSAKLNYYNASLTEKLIFEFFYGMDFISIEYFFRGFLVLGFMRYVGIYAVLPMSCFYMSIHFGKPLGEAISSFFGGTILGVISFHSRSIYGGIMVHMGIAWLMELGATIGNLIKDHFK